MRLSANLHLKTWKKNEKKIGGGGGVLSHNWGGGLYPLGGVKISLIHRHSLKTTS